ncbi:MAG: hypothetical protein U1E25_00300 [Methylocystis sp.]
MQPATATASTEPITGVKIQNLGIAANNLARYGIIISGAQYPSMEGVYCEEAIVSCIDLAPAPATMGGYCGIQHGHFQDISVVQNIANGNNIRSFGDSSGLVCNASVNVWENVTLFHSKVAAIVEMGTDNNIWRDVGIFKNPSGPATNSIYAANLGAYYTNNLHFDWLSATLPAYLEAGTHDNWFTTDSGNGTPAPTGSGTFHWNPSSSDFGAIAGGAKPTITGSDRCTLGSPTGGALVGKFSATAACAVGGTYTFSGFQGSLNGYACQLTDRTTPGVVFQQTSDSNTTAVMTVRSVGVNNGDVIQYQCSGY